MKVLRDYNVSMFSPTEDKTTPRANMGTATREAR